MGFVKVGDAVTVDYLDEKGDKVPQEELDKLAQETEEEETTTEQDD